MRGKPPSAQRFPYPCSPLRACGAAPTEPRIAPADRGFGGADTPAWSHGPPGDGGLPWPRHHRSGPRGERPPPWGKTAPAEEAAVLSIQQGDAPHQLLPGGGPEKFLLFHKNHLRTNVFNICLLLYKRYWKKSIKTAPRHVPRSCFLLVYSKSIGSTSTGWCLRYSLVHWLTRKIVHRSDSPS